MLTNFMQASRFIFFSDISNLQQVLQDKQKRGILLNALLNKSRITSLERREVLSKPKEDELEDILLELNQ